MTGSYDTEDSQNERYRLSFTVGGLLAEQGRIIPIRTPRTEQQKWNTKSGNV